MCPVGFQPTISADELPRTYALDRAATGTGTDHIIVEVKIATALVLLPHTPS